MAVSVKMSSKNQIVVPKEAREALGLRPGERLLVRVRGDDVIEMEPEPRDHAEALAGLFDGMGPELWPELEDGV